MTTGPKLGSGYARWRPPSKAAAFVRRWRWAIAAVSVVGLTTAGWLVHTVSAGREAGVVAKASPLVQIRAHVALSGPISTSSLQGQCPQTTEALCRFVATLSDPEIDVLSQGTGLLQGDLSQTQQDYLKRAVLYHSPEQWRSRGLILLPDARVGYGIDNHSGGFAALVIHWKWASGPDQSDQSLFLYLPPLGDTRKHAERR